jgi:hypothetical protein
MTLPHSIVWAQTTEKEQEMRRFIKSSLVGLEGMMYLVFPGSEDK